MRVLLVDLPARDGVVSKDTVAGGYGSRLAPFSRVTQIIGGLKRRFHDVPSVQLAYVAGILAQWGHEVVWSRGALVEADEAIVLSSLVDYRNECAWADTARARGIRTGFVGLTVSKLPDLFRDHADFLILGEPESAIQRLAQGVRLEGDCASEEIGDLDSLPFPRWNIAARRSRRVPFSGRPYGGGFPLLASRGCPEFCTYCPHRILSGYRARSVASIADELAALCDLFPRPYVIFRDPLFTEQRDRALGLADEIRARRLDLRFECETRLDRLDPALIDALHAAGLRAMSFGVESMDPQTLRRAGRRPTPAEHQRLIVDHCRRRGIVTAGFYVLGFLQDDWNSIAATIDFAIDLGTSVAQFKLLTPYPATPLWKQMAPRVYERDWQKFDGFTPTFEHPNLSAQELRFLLGAAYTRFYMRPSWLANFWRIRAPRISSVVRRMDARVARRHAREEYARMARTVTC
ncbi:MAG TPA: radical SAM protein [Vicinamibacterales bacterium]|nr:radical SAM protein [Vicinamibacterales bacterium]